MASNMLFLQIQVGDDPYVIEARRLVEVLPLVILRKVGRAGPGVVGTLEYRRTFVPVIDLCELMLGRPARSRLSTRILLVQSSPNEGTARLVGLIAENATETVQIDPKSIRDPGVVGLDRPYLGGIAVVAGLRVQRIETDALFPSAAAAVERRQAEWVE